MSVIIVTASKDVDNGDLSKDNISLREAISLANDRPGFDRIEFADHIDTIRLRDALPRINDDLRLVGGGDVVLDANADPSSGEHRRALDIGGHSREIEVTIKDLTITGGDAGDPVGGGGVRSGQTADLAIVDCTIAGNRGERGGEFFRRANSL